MNGLTSLSDALRPSRTQNPSKSYDFLDGERRRAEYFNARPGTLEGYNCPICRNRGGFMELQGRELVFKNCQCQAIRAASDAMKRSGLSDQSLEGCTFENWQTIRNWQRQALEMAKDYVNRAVADPNFSAWFILCGRPGCGKTMLCYTVFKSIVEKGRPGKYLSWRDFSREAKALANDHEGFQKLVRPMKGTPLLYIDDFWKGQTTPADVNLSFEILNDRYAGDKLTILSSEHTLEAILTGDEAIGSRLVEKSKGYYMDLRQVENWRMLSAKGGQV